MVRPPETPEALLGADQVALTPSNDHGANETIGSPAPRPDHLTLLLPLLKGPFLPPLCTQGRR